MNWLYFIQNNRNKDAADLHLLQMYLRPFERNAENELLVGEKIVCLDIIALDKYLEIEKDNPEAARLYFEKLKGNEYAISYHDVQDKDLYQSEITVCLAVSSFTLDEAWDWVKKVFVLNDYPFDSFTEGTYNEFADTNPIMRLFSLKNMQKFEGKLGKNWWKSDEGAGK